MLGPLSLLEPSKNTTCLKNEILDLDENLPQSGESAAEDPNADENASESDDSVDLEVVSAVKDNENSSKPPISLLDSKEEGNPSTLRNRR